MKQKLITYLLEQLIVEAPPLPAPIRTRRDTRPSLYIMGEFSGYIG